MFSDTIKFAFVQTADMDILASWHRIPENAKHPIVIIIEDAELCNADVLADFIITLRCTLFYLQVFSLYRCVHCVIHKLFNRKKTAAL